MTDNEKIARLAGWEENKDGVGFRLNNGPVYHGLPDYSTDAEAIELLNVLVDKGYVPCIEYSDDLEGWRCAVYYRGYAVRCLVDIEGKPTIHEALVAAVLAVIDKEDEK